MPPKSKPKIQRLSRLEKTGAYWESMRTWERGLIEWAMEIAHGDYDDAANVLGVSRSLVYTRCRDLEIDITKYKPPEKKDDFKPEPTPVFKESGEKLQLDDDAADVLEGKNYEDLDEEIDEEDEEVQEEIEEPEEIPPEEEGDAVGNVIPPPEEELTEENEPNFNIALPPEEELPDDDAQPISSAVRNPRSRSVRNN